MTEKVIVKTQSFTFKSMALLQKAYPELVSAVDWNGLYKYVQCRLWQFKMISNYSPDNIIIETIWRWDRKTKKGESIPNIEAWMKSTAFNCIRELNRQDKSATASKRVNLCDPSTFETNPFLLKAVTAASVDNIKHIDNEDIDNDKWRRTREAMSKLPKDKRELLELRIIQNLSWDEVSSHYATEGKNIKVATLRKRGERALEELRQAVLYMVQQ